MSERPTIPVVVLAAGASTRFGSDKLLASVDERTLLDATLDEVTTAIGIDRVLVVVGPEDDERAARVRSRSIRVVVANAARGGMRWSIDAGLAAVDDSVPGAVLVLGDDPLAARALPAVLDAAAEFAGSACAVRRASDVPHPVYLPRVSWPEPTTVADDRGLRHLLDSEARWLELTEAPSCDVDVPADLVELSRLLEG